MEERRQFKRVSFRAPIQYQQVESPLGIGSVAFDLSEGGIRFYAEDFIPLNAQVLCELRLNPEQSVGLTGIVAWIQKVPHSESYHVGLQFMPTSLSLESKSVLGEYLNAQSA